MTFDLRTRSDVNMQKLEEAVHYVCGACGPKDQLGAVKLNKILYYSDMVSFATTGEAITNATYVKRARGPVPKEVVGAISNLVIAGRLNTRQVSVFSLMRREFEIVGKTNRRVLGTSDIHYLNDAIRFVCGRSAREISDISHTVVWESADIGEILPYETFLVSYLGEIDENDMAVAKGILRKEDSSGVRYI